MEPNLILLLFFTHLSKCQLNHPLLPVPFVLAASSYLHLPTHWSLYSHTFFFSIIVFFCFLFFIPHLVLLKEGPV